MLIHSPTLISTHERTRKVGGEMVRQTVYDAVTGCGLKLEGLIGRNLLSVGLSAWASDLTCPECRVRIGLPPEPTTRTTPSRPDPTSPPTTQAPQATRRTAPIPVRIEYPD